MRQVLAIAGNGLRRLLRDRSNIFFVFILPLGIILLVGAQFGSSGVGTVIAVSADDDPIARALVDGIAAQDGLTVEEMAGEAEVVAAVERSAASAGVVIPPDLQRAIADGDTPRVGVVVRPDDAGGLQPVIAGVVADVTAPQRVGRVLSEEADIAYEEAVAAVEPLDVPGVALEEETVGESLFPRGTGQFSVGAAQQLVLFVFLTALTGSAALIESRRLGVSRRMMSTPTSTTSIVIGEGAGRFSVGLFQGLYIVAVTYVAFGVTWGDLLGGLALLVGLAATGAGAAMLLGTLFDNDQQAGGFSILIGLGLAALGGCMLPLELFSPTLERVAHATPHAWAIDGFSTLVYRGGTLGDVLPEVGVLFAYATVVLAVAGWRLRAKLTSAA